MERSGLSTRFTMVLGKMGMYWVLFESETSPSKRQNSKKSSRSSLWFRKNLLGGFRWAPLPLRKSSMTIKLDIFQIYGNFPNNLYDLFPIRNPWIRAASKF